MEEKNQNAKNAGEMNGKRSVTDLLLACLFYVAACSYLPLAIYIPMSDWLSAVVALAVCALGIAVLARMARTFRAVLTYAVILGLFVLFGGMLLPIGLLSAFVASSCIFTYFLLKDRTPFLWGLPLSPLTVSLLITQSATGAALSLLTLPCSLMLAHSVKNKVGRVGAVCRISFGICLSAVLVFACAVYSSTGELSAAVIRGVIDSGKEQLTVLLKEAASEMQNMVGYELTSLDVENVIELAVSSLFNLLPAIVITVANITAYVIHSLYLSVAYTSDEERKETLPMLSFDMSLTSAIVYIASLILALVLTSDAVIIYGAVAQNLLLVLDPGLRLTALAGIRMLTTRRGPSCLGTLLYFAVIFMLASLSVFAILGVSLLGAVLIIIANISKRKSDKEL